MGCTARQLLLDFGVDAESIEEAGFSIRELRDIGISAACLFDAGFSQEQLRRAGFDKDTVQQVAQSRLLDAVFQQNIHGREIARMILQE